MLESLRALAAPAVLQRLTLLINHVLASETAATHRLRGHAGRRLAVRLGDWPELLPDPPPLVFAITPAGLLDWLADLQVRIDARNPALALLQGLGGQRPRIEVSGDAALAADVSWLFENLRWDLEDDPALREAATRLARWTGGSDPAGPPPR
ncbi:hypothetical protein ABXN37_09225 [Piscinibacter sakaiensis]|uniref:hypothetical protein n=1 Tax=Piscinibacter sakaiensis TaxID=1547922 RepID=UPI00372C01D8